MMIENNEIKNEGFTLLEILIAVTITAIIFVGIVSVFDLGISTLKRSEDTMDQEWRIFDKILKKDLLNLNIIEFYPDNEFKSEYGELKFSIKANEKYSKVKYYFDPYNNVLKRELHNDNKKEESAFFSEINISGIEFKFFDRKEGYWKDSWNYEDVDELPELLKLVIYFPRKKKVEIIGEIYIGREY